MTLLKKPILYLKVTKKVKRLYKRARDLTGFDFLYICTKKGEIMDAYSNIIDYFDLSQTEHEFDVVLTDLYREYLENIVGKNTEDYDQIDVDSKFTSLYDTGIDYDDVDIDDTILNSLEDTNQQIAVVTNEVRRINKSLEDIKKKKKTYTVSIDLTLMGMLVVLLIATR